MNRTETPSRAVEAAGNEEGLVTGIVPVVGDVKS